MGEIPRLPSWRQRADGYYEAVGFTGVAVSIIREDAHVSGLQWAIYAGDRTEPRARARTISQAKARASSMFG